MNLRQRKKKRSHQAKFIETEKNEKKKLPNGSLFVEKINKKK